MTSLTAMPPEILAEILQSCNLIALSSTCNEIHCTWVSNQGVIIWHVGSALLVCFGDALMAVRATQIVEQAFQNKTLPPGPSPIKELDGQSRKPSFQEFKSVLDLEHLVDYLADCYDEDAREIWEYHAETCEDYTSHSSRHHKRNESCSDTKGWRISFSRSIYRIFFLGAMAARHYQKPFLSSLDRQPPGFSNSIHMYEPTNSITAVRECDIQFFGSFPVYKMMEYDDLQGVFGSFVTCMAKENNSRWRHSKSHYLPKATSRSTLYPTLSPEQHALLQETLHLLSVFSYLIDSPCGPIWTDRLRYPTRRFNKKFRRVSRKMKHNQTCVPVVMMDYYHLEEIILPPDGKIHPMLNTQSRYSQNTSKPAPSQNISNLLEILYAEENRPNHHNGLPSPPLNLHLFSFILRKCFNLRFADDFFALSNIEGDYESLTVSFFNHSRRDELAKFARLVSADDTSVISYSDIEVI